MISFFVELYKIISLWDQTAFSSNFLNVLALLVRISLCKCPPQPSQQVIWSIQVQNLSCSDDTHHSKIHFCYTPEPNHPVSKGMKSLLTLSPTHVLSDQEGFRQLLCKPHWLLDTFTQASHPLYKSRPRSLQFQDLIHTRTILSILCLTWCDVIFMA